MNVSRSKILISYYYTEEVYLNLDFTSAMIIFLHAVYNHLNFNDTNQYITALQDHSQA